MYKTFQSQQIGKSQRHYGSGGDYICTLLSLLSSLLHPPHFPVYVHPSFHPLCSYPFSRLICFLSFSHLSVCLSLSLPQSVSTASFLSPSSLLQSLACCLAHATDRSWLTDGWMARAEAIRHWAESGRTGAIHYQNWRLCLIFNLYVPGETLHLTKPCGSSLLEVLWHFEFLCASSAEHLSHFGEDEVLVFELWFFSLFLFSFPLPNHQTSVFWGNRP